MHNFTNHLPCTGFKGVECRTEGELKSNEILKIVKNILNFKKCHNSYDSINNVCRFKQVMENSLKL